jgi:FkbM family methyltransferase
MATVQSAVSNALRSLLRSTGREVVPYTPKNFRSLFLKRVLDEARIDLFLDVGANAGQTGHTLREIGYTGSIFSFEPLAQPFAKLQNACADDPDWRASNVALGTEEGENMMHVMEFDTSSSMLRPEASFLDRLPGSSELQEEVIQVQTLEQVTRQQKLHDRSVYLKIDTQGSELDVLRGGEDILSGIDFVEAETSLVKLYEGQNLIHDVLAWMYDHGFRAINVFPHFMEDDTGFFSQADVVFTRMSA